MKDYFNVINFYDSNGNRKPVEQGLEDLDHLCTIIINSHYSYVNEYDKADLRQEGMIKALDLLASGAFDPTVSSLKNYLYTGLRNEMKNYLYRNTKDSPTEDEILYSTKESEDQISDIELSVATMKVFQIKEILEKTRGIAKIDKVVSSLKSMGFNVDYNGNSKRYKEVDRYVALIIWEVGVKSNG